MAPVGYLDATYIFCKGLCALWLPPDMFYNSKNTLNGKSGSCRDCSKTKDDKAKAQRRIDNAEAKRVERDSAVRLGATSRWIATGNINVRTCSFMPSLGDYDEETLRDNPVQAISVEPEL